MHNTVKRDKRDIYRKNAGITCIKIQFMFILFLYFLIVIAKLFGMVCDFFSYNFYYITQYETP